MQKPWRTLGDVFHPSIREFNKDALSIYNSTTFENARNKEIDGLLMKLGMLEKFFYWKSRRN